MSERRTTQRLRRQRPAGTLAAQKRRLAGDIVRLALVVSAIALLARWGLVLGCSVFWEPPHTGG